MNPIYDYSYKTIKHPSYNGKPFTKANLHEHLNEFIVEINKSEDHVVVTEDVIDNNDSTLLVNSTTENKINPGDIRELMSTPSKGNHSPSSTKKILCEPEININGKICREAGKHIIYFLSKVSHS